MSGRFTAVLLAGAMAAGVPYLAAAWAPESSATRLSAPAVSAAAAVQQRGRYKRDGDNCVWDANDSGPNQCTPVTRGRFKSGPNNSCTWDANDSGPDQCRPPKGRWKSGPNNSCTWDGNDEGPNQCNPRQPR